MPAKPVEVQKGSITTSAVQITGTFVAAKYEIVIKADDDNSGDVYVAARSDVSASNGFRLAAGQARTYRCNNDVDGGSFKNTDLYAIGSASGQKVYMSIQ